MGRKEKETGGLRKIRRFTRRHRGVAPQCRQPPAYQSQQAQVLVVSDI
jgi:hypothetical protein